MTRRAAVPVCTISPDFSRPSYANRRWVNRSLLFNGAGRSEKSEAKKTRLVRIVKSVSERGPTPETY